AAPAIQAYLDQLFGANTWPTLRTYRRQVLAQGLAASQPAPDLLAQILALAAEALQQRGYGEEVFIEPLFARLQHGLNPAQQALRIFEQRGLAALIDQMSVP